MTVRANTEAVRRYRRTPEGREQARRASRVWSEAVRRLRLAHADEFKRLLDEVWAEQPHNGSSGNSFRSAKTPADGNGSSRKVDR